MNLKKTVLLLALLPALAFPCMAQQKSPQGKTELDIRLKGLKKGESLYVRNTNRNTIDTIVCLRDGRAEGAIATAQTGEVFLFQLPEGKTMKDISVSTILRLYVNPGDRLKVNGSLTDLDAAQITGGLYDNPRYRTYFDDISRIEAGAIVFSDSIRTLLNTSSDRLTDQQKADLNKKIKDLNSKSWAEVEKTYHYMDQFIRSHPSDVFSAYVLGNVKGSYGAKNAETLYNLLSPEVRATPAGLEIANRLAVSKAWEAANQGVKEGTPAPGFTLTGIDGKKVSLSDFRGKYVVLDFWGSWCGPCRKANPHMVAMYNRYKDRPDFAMISLALDKDDAAWRKAVKEDGLTWTQVNMSETPESPSSVSVLYGVNLYPTQMLLGPDGTILIRQNGFSPENDKVGARLAEIFTK